RGAAVPALAGQARGGGLPAGRGGAAAAEPPRRGAAAAAVRPRRGPPLRPALPPHPAPQADAGRGMTRAKECHHGIHGIHGKKRKTEENGSGDDRALPSRAFGLPLCFLSSSCLFSVYSVYSVVSFFFGRSCRVRILLTNDDGIHAPGLRALRAELRKLGEVVVVAPATEQSAVGHSITLSTPLVVQQVFDEAKEFLGWAVEGR